MKEACRRRGREQDEEGGQGGAGGNIMKREGTR